MAIFQKVIWVIALFEIVYGCSSDCPQLWTNFEGNCYRLFEEQLLFSDAEESCAQIKMKDCYGNVLGKGHLASIHSEEEQTFLTSYVRAVLPDQITSEWDPQVFIGAKVGSLNSIWSWTDGSDTDYDGWFPGEPNNSPDSVGAIAAGEYAGGLWADVYINNRFPYICKLPCVYFE